MQQCRRQYAGRTLDLLERPREHWLRPDPTSC